MKTRNLNLARRPFVNARPVRRLTALLWVLGAGLLVLNVLLYWQYFSYNDDSQHEREALRQRIARHQEQITANQAALAQADLRQQNTQVDFLNRKIAERTFPWSRLFDHLEEVLPNDVRLQSLAPNPDEGRTRGGETVLPGGRVRMKIVGLAKTVEAELELIDRLFAHPSFERPRLQGDSEVQGGNLRFTLQVTYFPERPLLEGDVETRQARQEVPADPAAGLQAPAGRNLAAAPGAGAAPPTGRIQTPTVGRRAAVPPAAGNPLTGNPQTGNPQTGSPSAGTPPAARPPNPRRGAAGPAEASGEDAAPPADPSELARRNRRPASSGAGQQAPRVTAGGSLVLPGNAAGADSGADAPGRGDSSGSSATARRTLPAQPGTGGDGGGLSGDPRDPRQPSPRTPSASDALEVQ